MVTEGGLPAQSLTRRSMHLFVAQTSRVEKIQMHLSDYAVCTPWPSTPVLLVLSCTLLTICPTGGAAAEHLECDADTLGVREFAVALMSSSTWLPLPQIPGLYKCTCIHGRIYVHRHTQTHTHTHTHRHTHTHTQGALHLVESPSITGPESPLISPYEAGKNGPTVDEL